MPISGCGQKSSPTRLLEMLSDRFGVFEAIANSSIKLAHRPRTRSFEEPEGIAGPRRSPLVAEGGVDPAVSPAPVACIAPTPGERLHAHLRGAHHVVVPQDLGALAVAIHANDGVAPVVPLSLLV